MCHVTQSHFASSLKVGDRSLTQIMCQVRRWRKSQSHATNLTKFSRLEPEVDPLTRLKVKPLRANEAPLATSGSITFNCHLHRRAWRRQCSTCFHNMSENFNTYRHSSISTVATTSDLGADLHGSW